MNDPTLSNNPLAYLHEGETRLNNPERALADETEVPALPDGVFPRGMSEDYDGPTLMWKGKVAEDAVHLTIRTLPVVVEEHIQPEVLIKQLPRRDGQMPLFETVDQLDEEKQYQSYRHERGWENRMILGDSLAVMQSMAEADGLRGKVQMIYIDPPYGIKFGSNWQPSTRSRDVKDGKLKSASREPEVIRAFRDTWEDGVNSYLSYLRNRLLIARDLLNETGSIFLQIGDENVHLIRSLMDEVFGKENFNTQIAVAKTAGGLESTSGLPSRLDYIVWYAKDLANVKYHAIFEKRVDDIAAGFTNVQLPNGTTRTVTKAERQDKSALPHGARLFRSDSLTKPGPGSKYEITVNGRQYDSGTRWWGSPKETIEKLIALDRVRVIGSKLRFVKYLSDFGYKPLGNLWDGLAGAKDPIYVVQTNEVIVDRCLLMTTDPGDLVLDPTCGSGTTAVVAEDRGRRWITIDTSRVSVTLARQRVMSTVFPWYLLRDSQEGDSRAEKEGIRDRVAAPFTNRVSNGFVCEIAPHITPSAIARNNNISPGMSLDEMESLLALDVDFETLYDRPYLNKKRIRVSGPFTVESLMQESGRGRMTTPIAGSLPETQRNDPLTTERVLEFLRANGIINPDDKNARVKFRMITPTGDPAMPYDAVYTNAEGREVTSGIFLVATERKANLNEIRLAARTLRKRNATAEALFVMAWGFESDAPTGPQPNTDLTIYPVRLGHELHFGDKTLKKTGTAGLFTLFGEPDVQIRWKDKKPYVELAGLDLYNPMTRELKSVDVDEESEDDKSLDPIAAWFVDTNYDGIAFHVRQAYFMGAKNPYERLSRTLKAEIDPEMFDRMTGSVGQPFPIPETGRVAVKVINHYGDEAFKVLPIATPS